MWFEEENGKEREGKGNKKLKIRSLNLWTIRPHLGTSPFSQKVKKSLK